MIHLNTNKIIITTDFSETSFLAIKHGAFLAQYTKGEVYLLHVIAKYWEKFNVFTPSITIENIEKASAIVQQKLEDLASTIRKDYGIKVTTVVNTGNPTTEILKYAKEIGAGMVVMGTHGYSAWEDLTIGSNALKVLTQSPCPVLTVTEHTNKFGYKKIILPLDMSVTARQKVTLTMELAKQFASQVYVLGMLPEGEEDQKGSMQVVLNQVEAVAKEHGVMCSSEIVTNVANRARTTVKYCEEKGGDLIVIMTDQDAELSGLFLGPYTLQVIHHSKAAVLSVKPEDLFVNGNDWGLAGT
ncbi:MAG: universal stress protein [Bacteroidia bacterium]|nr:universal stress protein [Bacteroidia bacterium]